MSTKMSDVAKVANSNSKPDPAHGRGVSGDTKPPSAGDTKTNAPAKKIETPSGKPAADHGRTVGSDWSKYKSAGTTKTPA